MNLKEIVSNNSYIFFLLIFLFIKSINLPIQDHSLTSFISFQFIGVAPKEFDLYTYLSIIIVFLFPALIFTGKIYAEITGDVHYRLMRYLSFENWLNHNLKLIIRQAFTFIFAIFAYNSVLYFFQVDSTNHNLFDNVQVFYHFIVNGFLQLLNYYFVFIIIIFLTKKIELIELYIGIYIILGFPLFNHRLIFPVALNSIGYIEHSFNDPLRISVILIIYLFLELWILKLILIKKVFKGI